MFLFPVTLIQRKWKSIRACYTRELLRLKGIKSGSAATRKKQYVYFELLRFLETSRKETTSTINEEEDANIDETEHSMLLDHEHTPFSNNSQERSRKKRVKTDLELIEVLKRKVASTENNKAVDETDEDKLFLLSMLSDIKKVPAEMKLKLRGDIISLVAAAQGPV